MLKKCADNWHELVQKIKSMGMRPGVSLKPGTPIEKVYPLVWYSSHPKVDKLMDARDSKNTKKKNSLHFLYIAFLDSQIDAKDPVEVVLVMTVEPGFGGQKFMPEMMDKVHKLVSLFKQLFYVYCYRLTIFKWLFRYVLYAQSIHHLI